MSAKKKNDSLNNEELTEIKEDVKDALGKALDQKSSIDKTKISGTSNTLNQDEVDKILKGSKKRTSKLPIVIAIVLIVLFALAGLYIYIANNPKTIFLKAIDKTFTSIENYITPAYNKAKGKVNIDAKIDENDFNIALNYKIDTKKSIIDADIKTTLNDEQLLDFKAYGETDDFYIYSEDLLDKYIELEDINVNKDSKVILESLKKAFTQGITGERLNGSKEQIKINNKIISVYKSTFVIGESNMDRILERMSNALNKDSAFLLEMKRSKNLNKKEINILIDEKADEFKKIINEKGNLTIDIYTTGFMQKFIMLNMNFNKTKESINITKEEEAYTYELNSNNKISGNVSLNKDSIQLNGTIEENNKKTNYDLAITKSIEKAKSVEKQKIVNSVKDSELSELQQTEIFIKLISNPAVIKLFGNQLIK